MSPLSNATVCTRHFAFVWTTIGVLSLASISLAADSAASLQIASGFTAKLWASDPLIENPVAFSFDDRGRCYVAETHRWSQSIFDITKNPSWLSEDLSFRSVQDRSNFLSRTFSTNFHFLVKDSERVRWLEDRGGLGTADVGGVFASGFQNATAGTAAGVLAHGRDVWFACIPDLWRMRSGSASGEVDQRQVLHSGYGVHIGVSGHDLHGLKMGPDGRLYFSIGDRGFNLATPSTAPASVAARRGSMFSLSQPDTGAVLRCDPDGSHLEVFAIGLRNPQELTFDDEGNLWTGDNDTAGADDSRLLYVVEGGDYGWRCSYQHQQGFGPWVQENLWRGDLDDALPHAGMVAQGPSGLDHYPGTGLGSAMQGHFLMCDFPGGIWDFTVTNRGAGFFLSTRQKFVWGLWPTDVEFGPDGAVYASDWVAGWEKPGKGRLYRITKNSPTDDPLAAQTRDILKRGLESGTEARLEALLPHPDQRVRLRAQWILASRGSVGLSTFVASLHKQPSVLARVHAVWGLGQLGRMILPNDQRTLLQRSLGECLKDPASSVRAQAARVLGDLGASTFAKDLSVALQDPEPRVKCFAAISLGRLGSADQLPAVLRFLRENADADPYLRHAGMMALMGVCDAEGLLALRRDESASVRLAAVLGLRRWAHPQITRFLNDESPRVVIAAGRAINDVPIESAMPQLAAFLGKVDCTEALITRAINANLRVGEARNATVLATYAGRKDVTELSRVAALEALATWEQPAPLDRVMGLWRPIASRNPEPARRALRAAASALMSTRSENVSVAFLRAAAALRIKEVGHAAFEFMSGSNVSATLRVEVLKTLAAIQHSRWPEALQVGLQDSSSIVRGEALRLAAKNPRGDIFPQVQVLLSATNSLSDRQVALSVLGQLADPRATAWILNALQSLSSSQPKTEPGLVLDLLEAAKLNADREVTEVLASLPVSYAPLMEGGDRRAGERIFQEKVEVSCARCHRVTGVGGNVGPALDSVGKRLGRSEILESILRPNSKIAVGFEQAFITLKDGTTHSGTVRNESDIELTIENLDDGVTRVAKADIMKRERGLSPMPEGLEALLSRRELRDLLEYLSALK